MPNFMSNLVERFGKKKMVITAVTVGVVAVGTTMGVIAGTSSKKPQELPTPTQYVDANAIKLETGYGVSAKQIYLKLVNAGSITENDFQLGKPKDGFSGSFVIYANAAVEFNIRDTQKLKVTFEDGSEQKNFTEAGDYSEVIEVYSEETEQTYKFRVEFTVLSKAVYVEPETTTSTTGKETETTMTTSVTTTTDETTTTVTTTKADEDEDEPETESNEPEDKGGNGGSPEEPTTTRAPKTTTAKTTTAKPTTTNAPVQTQSPATQPPVTQPPVTQPPVTKPPYDPYHGRASTPQEKAWYDYAADIISAHKGIDRDDDTVIVLSGTYVFFCKTYGENNVLIGDPAERYGEISGMWSVWYFAGYDDETDEEIWMDR